MTAGTPVLTMREIRAEAARKHWAGAYCWCDQRHSGEETGLTLTAPPWSEARDGERVS
jgi:hypothetical protein